MFFVAFRDCGARLEARGPDRVQVQRRGTGEALRNRLHVLATGFGTLTDRGETDQHRGQRHETYA